MSPFSQWARRERDGCALVPSGETQSHDHTTQGSLGDVAVSLGRGEHGDVRAASCCSPQRGSAGVATREGFPSWRCTCACSGRAAAGTENQGVAVTLSGSGAPTRVPPPGVAVRHAFVSAQLGRRLLTRPLKSICHNSCKPQLLLPASACRENPLSFPPCTAVC